MDAVLMETPSRVMRRLDLLEGQSLPDLPELPSHSDADYTLPDSPPPKATAAPRSPSPNKASGASPDTPYTSTPAPSQGTYYRSSGSEATTATLRPPQSAASTGSSSANMTARPRSANHHDLDLSLDLDLPSFEATKTRGEQEFQVHDSLDDERDDMVVLSGSGSGSGTDSDRPATIEVDADQRPMPREYDVPLADVSTEEENEGNDENQRPIPASARAQRLLSAAAGANISLRRPHHKVSLVNSHATPKPRSSKAAMLVQSPSPLSERNSNTEDVSEATMDTPEVGRHASPVESPHQQHRDSSFPSLSTPSALRMHNKDMDTPVTGQQKFSLDLGPDLATPAAAGYAFSSPAAARRASHLLQTLRSTAKKPPVGTRQRGLRGTPHPSRVAATHDDGDQTLSSTDGENERDQNDSVELSTSSANDLTTLRTARDTSLPTQPSHDAAPATGQRFNGAKLNAYLHELNSHLASENQGLVVGLEEKTREVEKLRRELEEMSMSRSQSRSVMDASEEEQDHEKEAGLRDVIRRLEAERDAREPELDAARQQLVEQEAEFANKMKDLEVELCRVMEEQEKGVENARKEVEEERKRASEEVEALKLRAEKAEQELEQRGEDRTEYEEQRQQKDERIQQLEVTEAELRAALEDKVTELERVKADFAERTRSADDNLKQMEEALDESARQLIANEDEMEALKVELAAEKKVVASLKAQMSQLSLTKAKSPLANEVYNGNASTSSSSVNASNRDAAVISSLEEELEEAQHEIQQLREQLVKSNSAASKAALEIQDLQIKTLETHKSDLEGRVNSLKQQVSIHASSPPVGSRTPDKSLHFRNLLGVQTPKTPGPFLGNLSSWSPGASAADSTISPLLAQIHELEQIVEQLQAQLAEANDQIDDKLDRLEASGSGTISLARQLADARARIALLEGELERLTGQHGSLERVRTRLSKLACPECETTFDAAKLVQFRVDRSALLSHAVNGESNTTATHAANESLQTTLASMNAKLAALQTENSILQTASSRAKQLAEEKAAAVRQHAALQKDFQQARSEIATLEVELRTDRSRLKTLASEQALSGRTKASLEARLASAESELRTVKRELSSAVTPDAVERLRREKAGLVAERADLLDQLNALNERAARVDDDLTSTRASQTAMQAQLDAQIAEIQSLRDSLSTREAEKRILTDERADILRGVAGLQADLNRVRQDAVSLGLDLATVRRERDEMGRGRAEGAELESLRAELARARSKIAVFERKVAEHVCPSDANALVEMRARHSQEAKGLLVMIKYLKQRITREMAFRDDLAGQKAYLDSIVHEKQATIDMVMGQLGVRLPSESKSRKQKPSLRGAAFAVIAVQRMSSMSQLWRQQSAPKHRLRTQAYPDTRGRPFPTSS